MVLVAAKIAMLIAGSFVLMVFGGESEKDKPKSGALAQVIAVIGISLIFIGGFL